MKEPEEKIRRHGDGIYSRWSSRLCGGKGGWVYFFQYHWNGKRVTEKAEADTRGIHTLRKAKQQKAKREKEKNAPDFLPVRTRKKAEQLKKAAERDQQQEEVDARAPLLFDNAYKDYLECSEERFSRPRDERLTFENRLLRAFRGRYLDEITRQDIKNYYRDRLARTGAFAGYNTGGKAVSLRGPEMDIGALSRLYTFMVDDGYDDLKNPCHSPKEYGTYEPVKVFLPPSAIATQAIFDATESDRHRALFMLCYYTGARPESEPCKLTHGDVTVGDDDALASRVNYASTKRSHKRTTRTKASRELPMHPDVTEALQRVMLPRPEQAEGESGEDYQQRLDEWKATPIFRRGRSGERCNSKGSPWNMSSYRDQWSAAVAAAAKQHPELEGLWLRHFRNNFQTVLLDEGVHRLAVKVLMGHSLDRQERYYTLTDKVAEEAIARMGLAGRIEVEEEEQRKVRPIDSATPRQVCAVPTAVQERHARPNEQGVAESRDEIAAS